MPRYITLTLCKYSVHMHELGEKKMLYVYKSRNLFWRRNTVFPRDYAALDVIRRPR